METLQPEEAANRFLSPHEVGLTSYDEKIGVPVPQGDNFVVRAPFAYFSDPAQALIRRHIVDSIAAVATPAQ